MFSSVFVSDCCSLAPSPFIIMSVFFASLAFLSSFAAFFSSLGFSSAALLRPRFVCAASSLIAALLLM